MMATLSEQFAALNGTDLSRLQGRIDLIIEKLQEEYDLNRAQQIEIDDSEKINITQENDIVKLENEIFLIKKELDETNKKLDIQIKFLEEKLTDFSNKTIAQKNDEIRLKADELQFIKALEAAKKTSI